MVIPSIQLKPSGYTANKLVSLLPTNGDGDLTFARTTIANRINSSKLIQEEAIGVPRLDYTDGTCPSLLLEPQSTNLITYPLSFGNNYWTKSGANIEGDTSTAGVEKVVNGDFATDTDWNKNSNWTISGGVITADGSTSADANQNNNLPTVNSTYLVTYTISNYISGTFNISYGSALTSSKSANGTYTEQITASSTDRLRLKGSNPFGSIDNVSVKEVTGFSAPSVDDPTSAYKLITDTSTGGHDMYSNILSFSANTTYTFSSYIKKGELDTISMQYNSAGAFTTNPVTQFNLDTGVVVSSGNGLGAITELGNGWYKCSITATTGASISSERTWFRFGTSTGDGTSGVYIFGAQLEEQSFATSLMLPNTEGSTVTRVTDTVSKTGLANYINSTEGVLYAEISALSDDLTFRSISISDGTTSNRIFIRYVNSTNVIQIASTVSGVNNPSLTYTATDITSINKIAVSYKLNDFSMWVNGVNVVENFTSSVFPPNTLNRLSFDDGSGSFDFYGNCKDLRVYKTALTDAELTELTTL